jgi:hypothetical protein
MIEAGNPAGGLTRCDFGRYLSAGLVPVLFQECTDADTALHLCTSTYSPIAHSRATSYRSSFSQG